jgi:hypothetical protein
MLEDRPQYGKNKAANNEYQESAMLQFGFVPSFLKAYAPTKKRRVLWRAFQTASDAFWNLIVYPLLLLFNAFWMLEAVGEIVRSYCGYVFGRILQSVLRSGRRQYQFWGWGTSTLIWTCTTRSIVGVRICVHNPA